MAAKLIQRYRAYYDEERVKRMQDREGELYGALAVLGIEDGKYANHRESEFLHLHHTLRRNE